MKTKMNRTSALICFFALFILMGNVAVYAQSAPVADKQKQAEEKKAKVKAMKIAWITESLKLTPNESENFWPLYNEYQDKKEASNKGYRDKIKDVKKVAPEALTPQQADAMIDANLTHDQELLDLKKTYSVKLKNVIGSVKLVRLFEAEKEFNKLLLEKLKNTKAPAEK